jgi:hypothetical protein
VEQNPHKEEKNGPTNSRGPGIGWCTGVCVVSNGAGGLFFCFFGIDVPRIGTAGTERYRRVGVLEGDIVSVGAISVEFEQFRDPVVGVVLFDLKQELDGQLVGFDVAGDGKELTFFGVEGEQDHVVHFEGQLGEVLSGFGCQQFCFFEILAEGGSYCGVVVVACGISKAGTDDSQGEGNC